MRAHHGLYTFTLKESTLTLNLNMMNFFVWHGNIQSSFIFSRATQGTPASNNKNRYIIDERKRKRNNYFILLID
jgi:hypothetical protein